ncbi:hypothetical protein AM501_24120 [Aneurinibacillus migulanus]|uniref:hypothetical protein n=1 Tax=Aneurinibacillus migulanus TaxID=47500 RepID=UPI0005BE1883|nr:hypothetical protein [Aneurinibacillus migulanus]KIV58906.1 hypothetical protein TS64_03860 [Aneurinibacillus migulanus]KPD05862.1 hypothetical protein AM501_24120 [Aneurinibacillus migulanus]
MTSEFIGYSALLEGEVVEIQMFEEKPYSLVFRKWLKKEDAPGYFLLGLGEDGRQRILNDSFIEKINGVAFISLNH